MKRMKLCWKTVLRALAAVLPLAAAALSQPLVAAPAPPASTQDKPQWVLPDVKAPRLQRRTFDSAAINTKVSYFIYTPESYDLKTQRRFPVLYWLHGSGGGLRGVPQLAARFDSAMRAGKVPAMIIVFPNGLADTMWCDSKDGKTPVETIVMKELIPQVDATFRTIAAREARLIEGFSMGGYGAARLGLKYPEVFGAISMLAAGPLHPDFETRRTGPRGRDLVLQEIYGGDMEYFKALSPWRLAEQQAKVVRGNTPLRLVIGDRDKTLDFNRDFHEHLAQLNIPHTYTVLPGVGHNPTAVLDALGEASWEFYRTVFGDGSISQEKAAKSRLERKQPAQAAPEVHW